MPPAELKTPVGNRQHALFMMFCTWYIHIFFSCNYVLERRGQLIQLLIFVRDRIIAKGGEGAGSSRRQLSP